MKLVEQDVSISAKILQLVNSALFGLPREISTMKTAVSYLGIDMLHNFVSLPSCKSRFAPYRESVHKQFSAERPRPSPVFECRR